MKFPDISFYQQKPDFDILKTKTKRIILRSGQGIWPDIQFVRNRSESIRTGLDWDTYWFYDDRYSPKRQGDLLLSILDGNPKPLNIWCDWESTYYGEYGRVRDVVAFMQYLEKALPNIPVGMYTGYYWFLEHTNAVFDFFQLNYLKSRKLWLAWYTEDNTSNGVEKVKIPRPYKKMDIWQYGTPAIGKSYGVPTEEIDMNMSFEERQNYRKIIKDNSIYMERI